MELVRNYEMKQLVKRLVKTDEKYHMGYDNSPTGTTP